MNELDLQEVEDRMNNAVEGLDPSGGAEPLEPVEDPAEPLEPEYSEAEAKARKGGWRPQEEWEGEPDDWVSHQTFNIKGEMMDRIKSQGSQIRGYEKKLEDMNTALEAVKAIQDKKEQLEHDRVSQTLRDEKAQAIAMGDGQRVLEIEDKQKELDEAAPQPVEPQEPAPSTEVNPSIKEWMGSNDWYDDNKAMTYATDGFAQQYQAENPDAPVSDLLEYIDGKIREEFPHKFEQQETPRARATTVGKGTSNAASKASPKGKRVTAADLNDEQLSVMKTLVRSEVMSEQEYIDSLVEIGEL